VKCFLELSYQRSDQHRRQQSHRRQLFTHTLEDIYDEENNLHIRRSAAIDRDR
jgi:hypothetical protein